MRRSSRFPSVLVAACVVAGSAVVSSPAASAAEPSVTFTTPGQNVYTVPDGVTRVDVVAVGGTGGESSTSQRGGRAARVTGTLDVTPGQKLYAVVGTNASGGTPGGNGGGAAGGPGGVCRGTPGAGGGASDVRTVALGESGTDASRVLVAGGSGGGATVGADGGGRSLEMYGGHRGLGGGTLGRGGFGGRDGAGAVAGQGGAGGQTAGSATAGGRGGVGVAGQGSGCGGGGGGGFGGGGGGAAGPAGGIGGGGGGGGSLVPRGLPAGMAFGGQAPSVTFTAPGQAAPAGPLRITSIVSLEQNSQGAGGVPFTNCPSSCVWIDGDAAGPGPVGPDSRRDFGYASTQYWGSGGLQAPDFTQSGAAVRPGPDASPSDLGQPFLLSAFIHYNVPIRGDSPTALGIQTLLRVQPPAGPAAVFSLRGPDTIPLDLIETDNTPPCDPTVQQSGSFCDDLWTLRPFSRTTSAGGLTWRFELLGWRAPSGAFEQRFSSTEGGVNQRDIYGRVTVDTLATTSTLTVGDATPPVLTLTTTPVPQTGGTVTFTDGATPIPGCTAVPVDATDGVTTCTPSGLSPGAHTFGAGFGGGVGYGASAAAPVTSTPPAPVDVATTTVLTGPATGIVGRNATYTATVVPDPGGGTIAFTDGTVTVAGCEAVPVSAGAAACTTSALAAGPHVLAATYAGTAGFASSTSAPLAVAVGAPDPVDACAPGAPVPAGYKAVRGTDRPDVLVGSSGRDIVYAGGGDDVIATFGGDDIVCGGTGNDAVAAGDGNDVVSGGAGNDTAAGENGDDTLRGDAGTDRLIGGPGTDRGIDPDATTVRVGIERTS